MACQEKQIEVLETIYRRTVTPEIVRDFVYPYLLRFYFTVYEIPLVNVLYFCYRTCYHTQKDVQKESPKEKITVGAGEQYNSINNTSDITVTGNPSFPKWILDNTPDDDNLRKEYVKEENLVGNSTMRIAPSYENSFFKIDSSKNKDTITSNNVVIADNEF